MHGAFARSATAVALLLTLLAGCGGGDDAGDTKQAASGAAAALSAPEPSAAPTAPAADAAAYRTAREDMDAAFTRFSDAYATALAAEDRAAVVAAAEGLATAVADFDEVVRTLDLSAVQPLVDRLLELDAAFEAMLAEVPRARGRARAERIVDMLPFQDFVTAYEAVADAL